MDKSLASQNRTEITLNFLTSDWFIHYTANTKRKEGGSIFSSLPCSMKILRVLIFAD